jgi:hypothetical protein
MVQYKVGSYRYDVHKNRRKMQSITSNGCLLCIWEICLKHGSVQTDHLQVIHISISLKELLDYEGFVCMSGYEM